MYAKQIIEIQTKIKDPEQLTIMVQPIINFANKHEIIFSLNFNQENDVISLCEATGRTSTYCKGMVAEVKQMLKDIFNCKLNVLLYAY